MSPMKSSAEGQINRDTTEEEALKITSYDNFCMTSPM